MPDAAAVEVRNVSRLFQLGSEDVWALRDITLSVKPREFLALVGRSGSGKTTLLNIMAGLDRPTAGEVELDGQRLDTMPERQLTELRRHRLGFIFQSFGLLPLLSAQENVELPLRIAGFGHGDRTRRARAALDLVGLARRAHHRPFELSGGEQQRVAIARALATEPSLILADEPTGELDSATAKAVFGLLRALAREENITVIACTHDRLVMELADRVEELADGRLARTSDQVVWQHVQAAERSPFEAGRPEEMDEDKQAAALSSLIGADMRQFSRAPLSETPPAAAAPDAPDGPSDGDASDAAVRWSRPDGRSD